MGRHIHPSDGSIERREEIGRVGMACPLRGTRRREAFGRVLRTLHE
jgi:hypothetical protein